MYRKFGDWRSAEMAYATPVLKSVYVADAACAMPVMRSISVVSRLRRHARRPKAVMNWRWHAASAGPAGAHGRMLASVAASPTAASPIARADASYVATAVAG